MNTSLLLHFSSLLIFSSVLGEQRGLERKAAWKNIFVFFSYFPASSYLVTSQWPEIILKSYNSHLLLPYIKLTRASISFTNKTSVRLFPLFLGGKQVTEQTSRRRWKRMHHPRRWKLQNAIKANISGFSPNTKLTWYFHCFSGPFISADTRTHQRSNAAAWGMRIYRCSRNLLPEDWMNQQQSKLLEQEGTNERRRHVATQDMEEIQATSVPIFLLL